MLINQFARSFLSRPVAENKTREMVFICWAFFFVLLLFLFNCFIHLINL